MPSQYIPYRSQHAGTISDLILRGGRTRARGEEEAGYATAQGQAASGQIWGGAWREIGDAAAYGIEGVGASILAERERKRVSEVNQAVDDAFERLSQPPPRPLGQPPGHPAQRLGTPPGQGGQPPQQGPAARPQTEMDRARQERARLQAEGPEGSVELFDSRLKEYQNWEVDLASKNIDNIADSLENASQLAQGVKGQPTENRQTAWTRAYPTLQTLLEPLGMHVPRIVPEPDDLDQMIADGSTQSAHLETQKFALDVARDAIADPTKKHDAAAALFATSRSKEEWEHNANIAREFGVAEVVIAGFGDWSVENLKKAQDIVRGLPPRAEVGSAADFIERRAKEKYGKRSTELTGKEVGELIGEHYDITHDPDDTEDYGDTEDGQTMVQAVLEHPEIWGQLNPTLKGDLAVPLYEAGFRDFGADSLSPEAEAQIERWKTDKLIALDEQMRASRGPAGDPLPGGLTDAEYEERRQTILASHRIQLGAGPTQSRGQAGDINLPHDPEAARLAQVKALLKNEPPGEIQLTDGSWWDKKPDGTVTRIPE